MTTATDWDDPTWTDTGSHAVVTDVTSAAVDDAPIQDLEQAHTLAVLNAELSEQVRHLTDLVERLTEDKRVAHLELDALRFELHALKAQADPLTAPWTPDIDPPTLWTEETLIAQWAAAHRDSYDTHTYIARLHREHRQQWDSVHDDIEALSAHEPATVRDDGLRALTEPVQVDTSYRQSEAWLWAEMVVGQSRQPSVYAEAPDRIQDGPDDYPPPEHERQSKDPDLAPEHERQVDDQAALNKLKKRVPTAISAPPPTQVAGAAATYNETASEFEPPGWRRYVDLIVGGAIGLAAFGALAVAWIAGVLE